MSFGRKLQIHNSFSFLQLYRKEHLLLPMLIRFFFLIS